MEGRGGLHKISGMEVAFEFGYGMVLEGGGCGDWMKRSGVIRSAFQWRASATGGGVPKAMVECPSTWHDRGERRAARRTLGMLCRLVVLIRSIDCIPAVHECHVSNN